MQKFVFKAVTYFHSLVTITKLKKHYALTFLPKILDMICDPAFVERNEADTLIFNQKDLIMFFHKFKVLFYVMSTKH